ncbi:MAG: translation initiation factor IF-2 subunit gamma [Nitrososphaerota archaeon]|nr:translation initiation factor IF-2 subunit gamma [Candidatus Calditenuaceae archaeon]MDW8072735.1 translation initiation factor IF-2 subunit gamma [Nitrososphaerota archaeon]
MSIAPLPKQPEVNIGTLGHVDNGKSTLVQAITGVWTARHSEELKRGITIRVGYADALQYRCNLCEEPHNYYSVPVCPIHNAECEFIRAISFIDCPGHHSLMITMLSGAALFDGTILVADARVKFPQAQDREHLEAALIMGVSRMIVAQNKIDVVDKQRALTNYDEIKKYLEKIGMNNVPVIPVSAQQGVGIEALLYAMDKYIPTPKREIDKPFLMPVLRSFNVNLPGTPATMVKGGVIGGSIMRGKLRVGDEIEIAPGIPVKEGASEYESVVTEVVGIQAGGRSVEEATSGGLIGIETTLDPALTKSDAMVGNIAGVPAELPPVWKTLEIEYNLFQKVIGIEGDVDVRQISEKEPLVINSYTAVTSGIVIKRQQDRLTASLSKPLCAWPGDRVSLCRKIGTGWRLIGYGVIVG